MSFGRKNTKSGRENRGNCKRERLKERRKRTKGE
jgi:hypothetical protein